jgi:hypothetical protein
MNRIDIIRAKLGIADAVKPHVFIGCMKSTSEA